VSSSLAGSDPRRDAVARVVAVEDASQIGEARRTAVALALRLGFTEATRSDLAIVATEAATNAVRHGRGGRVVLLPSAPDETPRLELLCVDRGPGMANLAECLRDGYSTGGTPGNGLGAIARLSHGFDAYSRPGLGTALLCRFGGERPRTPAQAAAEAAEARVGGVSLPIEGETRCGDAWTAVRQDDRTLLLVADGLGHGPDAAAAADAAVRIFRDGVAAGIADPSELLDRAHRGLRTTRGAAAAVAEIPAGPGVLRYAGIGNIAASVHAGAERPRSLVSHNGIVGHQARRHAPFQYDWPQGALLVMHSDGLQTRWRLEDYPGLALRDPSLVAAVLYRDFSRGRDDVTVVAFRGRAASGAGAA
jgi:anti-sigma regulatory factor (Ser/Thr protein kinase)